MPVLRKLAPEEVQAIVNVEKEPSQRQRVAEEYDSYLADFVIGDYATVELGEDEARLTVANRLKAAAQRRDVALRFLRTTGNLMRFQVVDSDHAVSEDGSPLGSDTPPNASGRKRGRKKRGT